MNDKIGVLVMKKWVQCTYQTWQLYEECIPTANPHLIQPPSITYHQQVTNLPSLSTQSASEGVSSNGATNAHVNTTSRISEEEYKNSEFRPPAITYHQQETNLPSSSTQSTSQGVSSNGATNAHVNTTSRISEEEYKNSEFRPPAITYHQQDTNLPSSSTQSASEGVSSNGATNAHVNTTSRISEEEHIKSGFRPPSTSYHQQETNLPSSSTQSASEGVSSNGATTKHVDTTHRMSEEEYEKRFLSDLARLIKSDVRGESNLFQQLADIIAAPSKQSQQSSNNIASAVNNQSANSNIIGSKIEQRNDNTRESGEANNIQLPCSTKHELQRFEGRLLNDDTYREETIDELLDSLDHSKSLTGTVRDILRSLITSDVAKEFISFDNPDGIRFKNTQLALLLDDVIWDAYEDDEDEDVPPRYVIMQTVSRILHEMTAGRRRRRVYYH